MRDGVPTNDNPRLPLGGAAGAVICKAIERMMLQPGNFAITITKRRMDGGGYSYAVTHCEDKP